MVDLPLFPPLELSKLRIAEFDRRSLLIHETRPMVMVGLRRIAQFARVPTAPAIRQNLPTRVKIVGSKCATGLKELAELNCLSGPEV